MNTTNPNDPHGRGPQPGAGHQWPSDAGDGSRPDDSGGGGGVDPQALRQGHEEDVFGLKGVLSMPLAVVVFFLLAFGVVTAIVATYFGHGTSADEANPNPVAVERAAEPRNERVARVGVENGTGLPQPRLEGIRMREDNGKTVPRPETPLGNSPEYHPEDVRADRQPQLRDYGRVNGEFARIPIDEAMKLAVEKKLFKTQEKAVTLPVTSEMPTYMNAGRGLSPASVEAAPKKGDDDHGKKDEPKKDGGGKSEQAPTPKSKDGGAKKDNTPAAKDGAGKK